MEDELEPYVHYIPILPDYSDIHAMFLWAESHEKHVQWISKRASLFIQDLFFHPRSDLENAEVKFRVMSMYNLMFQ